MERLVAVGVDVPVVARQHPDMVQVGSVLRSAERHGLDYRLLFSSLTDNFDSTCATTSAGSSESAAHSLKN